MALNPLVSLIGRLVARSGRKRGNRKTDTQTDRERDRQNDKITTVTLAAHAYRGLIIIMVHQSIEPYTYHELVGQMSYVELLCAKGGAWERGYHEQSIACLNMQ